MALLGNYSVLLKLASRHNSGSSISNNRANWNNRSQQYQVCSSPSFNRTAGIPYGYRPPSSWSLPRTAGALSVLLSGSGTVSSADGASGIGIFADITGSGDITNANLSLLLFLQADLTGSGTINSADCTALGAMTAAVTGSGDITTATLDLVALMQAAITGSGTISSANCVSVGVLAANIIGTGDITNANLSLVALLSASLSGSGTISSATGTASGVLAAGLIGSGDVTTAGLLGKGLILADLTGTGVMTGTPAATGSMAAAITASGDVLTAGSVASAVWAEVLDAGYTAEEIIKLIAAVHLGTSSGSPTSPAFKGLDTVTTRVSGTVDVNGNRTAVTLNP